MAIVILCPRNKLSEKNFDTVTLDFSNFGFNTLYLLDIGQVNFLFSTTSFIKEYLQDCENNRCYTLST